MLWLSGAEGLENRCASKEICGIVSSGAIALDNQCYGMSTHSMGSGLPPVYRPSPCDWLESSFPDHTTSWDSSLLLEKRESDSLDC